MKMTLLEMVQSILSDIDAEEVNSIADTTEATQVASIIRDTFYNAVTNRTIPEFKQLGKLVSLGDIARPTHFEYGELTKIEELWYDVSDNNSFEYHQIRWCEPANFLALTDNVQGSYVVVDDVKGATKLRIRNDRMPSFYTSFDDKHIVMDAYDAAVDATLTSGKTRAYGVKYPTFDMTDDHFVPEIDGHYFPYLLAESKSVAMSVLHGGSDPKIEQAARRQKTHLQNDKYNTVRTRRLSNYGR